jgi:hypothetical protein
LAQFAQKRRFALFAPLALQICFNTWGNLVQGLPNAFFVRLIERFDLLRGDWGDFGSDFFLLQLLRRDATLRGFQLHEAGSNELIKSRFHRLKALHLEAEQFPLDGIGELCSRNGLTLYRGDHLWEVLRGNTHDASDA